MYIFVLKFFKVDVYDQYGYPYSEKVLISILKDVVRRSSQSTAHPVGILTSQNRDIWGRVYKHMRMSWVLSNKPNSLLVCSYILFIYN